MNDKLTIGVSSSPDKLMKMIETVLPMSGIEYDKHDASLSYINMDTGKDIITKIKLSDVLTEFIINEFEKKLALMILTNNYEGLKVKEKREILTVLEGILSKDQRRRSIVLNSMFSYLKEKRKLILEGFFNFRLYEYRQVLETMVDDAVQEYMVEREYEEFIVLLKHFVDAQSSMLDVMHIVALDNGTYKMYNREGDDITEKCFDNFCHEICIDTAFDDIVISSLVYMSPEKIVIHNTSNVLSNELLRTIDRVFEKRVEYCSGCEICNKNNGSDM